MTSAVRDQALLDALEAVEQTSFSGEVWRVVREGRKANVCSRSGGRWDDQTFDVLYTSLTKEGAIEECRFHLYRGQPIPPSKIRYELFTLQVELQSVLRFESLSELEETGLKTDRFGAASYHGRKSEYPRSQQIAEAAFFLGADGIIVPNARSVDTLNLIVFCEQEPPPVICGPQSHGLMDWQK